VKSFKTVAAFRAWLHKNHATEPELILRLYKVHASKKGIGYKEALDAALCYGWIDGVRHALDADSFTQRFTPRKARSNWSAVNIKRANELIADGSMHPAGLAAFNARDTTKTAPYSFENRDVTFAAPFTKAFKSHKKGWAYWTARPPYYRRLCTHWVMSAKREDTRAKRFAILLECSANERPIPGLESRG
jgi:uncharacterized protein YdeI (YjbR/CyaY-like superfamily)